MIFFYMIDYLYYFKEGRINLDRVKVGLLSVLELVIR